MPTIGFALACATYAAARTCALVHNKAAIEVSRNGIRPNPIPVPAPETKFPEFGGNRVRIAKDRVIVREEPDADSDKVTVVEIGRTAEALERKDGWYKIRFDGGTTGWVRADMLSAPKGVNPTVKKGNGGIPVTPVGPTEKDFIQPKRVTIEIDGDEEPDAERPELVATPVAAPAKAPKSTGSSNASVVASELIETAKSKIGAPYVWGATGSRGSFDCSGFVGWVFRSHGIDLPRTSIEQSGVGEAVGKDELRPGDLVFFHTRGGSRVSHVGMYIGNNNFIHASSSGSVKISSLEEAYYTRAYAWARRVAKVNGSAVAKDALTKTPSEDEAQRLRRQAAEDEKSKKSNAIGVDIIG
ncbi:MAG: C40 family peptidase [Armatimonadetes bacterium]|nr:C40 family peptidase [Armatimonadota bacterium]